MKIIITAEPEEMEAVMRLVLDSKAQFDRYDERPGWGWHFAIPDGRTFFLRHIKGGISAAPARPTPSHREG